MTWALRLTEDRLGSHARLTLPPAPRVLYVLTGSVVAGSARPARSVGGLFEMDSGTASAVIHAGSAWHGAGACALVVTEPSATVLRYELIRSGAPAAAPAAPVESRCLLEHAIALDPARAWLMRCDRVEFAPGGVALPHGHKGGGLRCLIAGTLEVTVGGHPPRLMRPGDAWFESGREAVLAKASPEVVTAFVRVSVLPREIRGQSSIVYVDPADAARGRPRQYTVYVDEPIDLTGA